MAEEPGTAGGGPVSATTAATAMAARGRRDPHGPLAPMHLAA